MTISKQLLASLRQALGEDAVLAPHQLALRSAGVFRDGNLVAGALVRPRNTGELAAAMRLCHEARQSVVTQGGLSGLVHGADAAPDELIVSMERMNAIERIDPIGRTALLQAGVTVQQLKDSAALDGLSYGVDFGARQTATLGGSVATNAGGNNVIRYGMTRESVLGLEVVLADGTVMSSLNHMLKNNSGYDLKHLFIGSEGTLGIVARLVLRLREAPGPAHSALLGCAEFGQVLALLRLFDHALNGQLSAFEVMWQDFFDLAVAGSASRQSPLSQAWPYYILIDCSGKNSDALHEALIAATEQGLLGDVVLAHSETQRKAMWALRESVGETFRHGPDFAFDISLPLAHVENYTQTLRSEVKRRWPEGHCWIFGHLGDNNIHVSLAVGKGDEQTRQQLETLVYEPLREIGGAVSAEHGIGLEKKAWLNVARNAEELLAMQKLKALFDPFALLNRGKVFDPLV